MSWITDIAGKAENFLNKIDQNAANVLTPGQEQQQQQQQPLTEVVTTNGNGVSAYPYGPPPASKNNSTEKTLAPSVQAKKESERDEELMQVRKQFMARFDTSV